jgi:hypothetical protein
MNDKRSGDWTYRKSGHSCDLPLATDGDEGDVWRCRACGDSWVVVEDKRTAQFGFVRVRGAAAFPSLPDISIPGLWRYTTYTRWQEK